MSENFEKYFIKTRARLLKWWRFRVKYVLPVPSLVRYVQGLMKQHEHPAYLGMLDQTLTLEHSDMQTPYDEARVLETLVRMSGAKLVLEVGTFRGFSGACIARALPEGGRLITIDRGEKDIAIAKSYWEELGLSSRIEVRVGFAEEILKNLSNDTEFLGKIDFIFIDADKSNYGVYLEQAMQLLRPGGVVLFDNVLWAGLVAYEHPGDNGGRHLRAFNELVSQKYADSMSIIPTWDGLMMIVKR
jgi:O-methyltransferase